MDRFVPRLAATLLLACMAVAPVFAIAPARAGDADVCANGPDPDAQISACTVVLRSGYVDREWAFNNRGDAHARKGDYDRAIRDYDQAIWIRSSYAIAYNNRGAAYENKNEYERAIRDYDRAGKLKRNTAAYQNNRCWIRGVLNRDLNTALDLCNLALALAPKDAAAFDSRGFVYFRLGALPQARADYDAALAIEPRLASSLLMRGIVKLRAGDNAGAGADIAAAKAIDPNIANRYARYGVTDSHP